MKLHELPGDPGKRQSRKRVGRGEGSGHGRTAGRGNKGAGSRSGAKRRAAFEGGQMPLIRRVPKRGFNNPFRVKYQAVSLALLEKHFEAGAVVDFEALVKAGVLKATEKVYKILAQGELTKSLTVKAPAFSTTAKEKITAAGGVAEVL